MYIGLQLHLPFLAFQQVIDGIDSVLHPDATVTKRNLVDVANQIEGVIAEISKVLSPDAKRNLVDIANQIEGVIGEISKILEPTAKRGVITDLANSLQVRLGNDFSVLV